ncbi:uncharacterized protein A4U43_C03F6560 [Asparagus officinalis]|uniref:Anaphase-promoting complex subunit 5 n=1 Tax=Asparagus officinalis TaxID=4686 RepID=A0A5P1F7W0_ASPOF|nr:uncharacterized protein A4U43_C03F6560 [Asparagus officinalis]
MGSQNGESISCDDFLEPSLEELINQLKAIDGLVNDWLCDQLMSSLSSLTSPDDLFNFFDKIRGVLATPDGAHVEDDQIFLDPNSHLGVFLRCCLLAFNLLAFEGVCHLLTNIGTYCNSAASTYELPEEDDYDFESEYDIEAVNQDLEDDIHQKFVHEFEADMCAGESSELNLSAPRSIYEHVEVAAIPKLKHAVDGAQSDESAFLLNDAYKNDEHQGFLRSKWQVEGYLNMQADLLEKYTSSFPLKSFDDILKKIEKLAPELHRVRYLQYLNGLYRDDYLAALDNLHRYFDYSAGMEAIFGRSAVPQSRSEMCLGRYETALLSLGTMHCHFGHSKKALEAFTEAVRISQQNNDDPCLAYTLAAICNLLSEIGISSSTEIIWSPLGTSTGLCTPLSAQQQLFLLLKRSLKRADTLKLICLVAFNHLALAKFGLKHVERPLISFGPKTTTILRTWPGNVCKELRLSSHVLSEIGSDGLSQPNDDGSFSTSWLKNLAAATSLSCTNSQKAKRSFANDYDVFHFGAQPNPIPASVLRLAGSSYLLRATSWELYGSAPLVRINSLVHVTCFADAASSSDLSLGYAKLIKHLAVFKGYKEAFKALELAEAKFSPESNKRMQLLRLQLLHERALHRGQLKLAQQVCDKFGVLASPVSGVDMEIKTEASIRHARTLLAANQFDQAADVAHSLFCTCYNFNLQVENATVLLLLAEIHKKSGNAVLALPYALASLSFCQSFNLDLLGASVALTLGELWLSLGSNHVKRALDFFYAHGTFPLILGHGGLELRARANITLAKCHLSDPNFSIFEDPYSVLDPLEQAAEELETLEYHEMAAEAYYLMSVTYNKLGEEEEREDAAASFKKHILALQNPQHEEDPLINLL